MKVFLVPNYYKNEAVESGLALELWLSRQGYEVAWAADQRSKIVSTPDIEGSDLVISRVSLAIRRFQYLDCPMGILGSSRLLAPMIPTSSLW